MHVLVSCKYKEDRRKGGVIVFPIISQWGLSVTMETRVLIRSAPKPYATPMMLHIKFDQDWPTGFRNIQVWKCRRRRTNGRWPLVYYKLTFWAFGSGELKIHRCLSWKCQRPFSSKSHMQFTVWYPPFCQQFTNHKQKILPNKHKTHFRNNLYSI